MMERKHELATKLQNILGSPYVYHQAPPSTGMRYPCFIYEERPDEESYANNSVYISNHIWDVTLIRPYKDRENNSKLVEAVKQGFQYRSHVQHFVSSGLIHDVFQITF